jgi:hypothetical protein
MIVGKVRRVKARPCCKDWSSVAFAEDA